MGYELPRKIDLYLRRLAAEYKASQESLKHEIITQCHYKIIENTNNDNWPNDMDGHDVVLYLSLETLGKIGLKNQDKIKQIIFEDLKILSQHVETEYLRALRFEMNDENDPHFQTAKPFGMKPHIDPDTLSIWKPGMIRLFISHRDIYKAKANELAAALEKLGISSFVAHDSIEATKEWTKEILSGLETMEVMLAFITDEFSKSAYTNQEIGFAIGSNKPIISLKLGTEAPSGFISHKQAMRGSIDSLQQSAQELYSLIAKELNKQDRLDQGLITAFTLSTGWVEAQERFDVIQKCVKKLNDDQLQLIIKAYHENSQLFGCIYLNNKYKRLEKYLERATDKKFKIESSQIIEINPKKANVIDLDEDVPF